MCLSTKIFLSSTTIFNYQYEILFIIYLCLYVYVYAFSMHTFKHNILIGFLIVFLL